jgi:membrane protein
MPEKPAQEFPYRIREGAGMSVAPHLRMFSGLRKPPIAFRELLERTGKEILDDDCLGMAAQLAYYLVLALFPALVVVVALVSYLPWSVLDSLVSAIDRVAPGEIVKLVRDQISELASGNHGGLLTIGVIGAVWTSSSALVSIVSTLNRAYEVTESRPWWKVRLVGIGLTVGLAVFIVGSLVLLLIGPTLTRYIESTMGWGSAAAVAWSILQYPLVFALASLGIALIYYFAPDVDQDWVWITPGSIVACLLWLIVSFGLKVYVSQFADYNATYGALGGAAILLLWMYLTGLAILAGGELNAEIEHALPEGKAPGERTPGQRVRLRAFGKQAPPYPLQAPQPSRVI